MSGDSHKLNTPFLRILHNTLVVWLADTSKFSEALVQKLLVEAENLYQVLDFGLRHEATWEVAARVVCQTRLFASRLSQQRVWLELVVRALVWCQEAGHLWAELLLVQGQLQRDLAELKAAFATFAEAEPMITELGNRELIVRLLYNLAETYQEDDQLQIAKQLCLQAIEQLEAGEDMPDWRAATLHILGNAQRDLGELDEALVSLKQALVLEEKMGDSLAYVRVLNNLGRTFVTAGQFEQAFMVFTDCLELLADMPYENDKLVVYITCGSLYVEQSQLEHAEEFFTKAIALVRTTPIPLNSQAIVFNNLGYLFFLQKRLANARYFLGEAITLRRMLSQDLRLANSIGSLGEVLLCEGDREGAKRAFDEALALVEPLQNVPWGARMRQRFADQRQLCM